MKKKPIRTKTKGYLHGFTREEQDRLYQQARFLEPYIFENIEFSKDSRILEVGSGVGAQTEILLKRFPTLSIECVDASESQLARAKMQLKKYKNRVHLHAADAEHLPFSDNTFDGAFLCWILEHVADPVKILKETHRTLKENGLIYINEVQNASFFVHPYSPATLQYWFEFNDHQWNMKGDPFVGAKLGNYLIEAGFQKIETTMKHHFYDNRTPKIRAQFIEFWTSLLLSGAPGLIKAKKVTPALVTEMKRELTRLKDDKDAVFIYSWVFAKARAL